MTYSVIYDLKFCLLLSFNNIEHKSDIKLYCLTKRIIYSVYDVHKSDGPIKHQLYSDHGGRYINYINGSQTFWFTPP